jgi:hypothetical protein
MFATVSPTASPCKVRSPGAKRRPRRMRLRKTRPERRRGCGSKGGKDPCPLWELPYGTLKPYASARQHISYNACEKAETPRRAPAQSLRGAAVGVIPPRLPRPRLSACEPSLTSPRTGSPAGMITERREPRRMPRPVLYSPAASPSRRALCARSWAAARSSWARNVGASGGALADGGGMGYRTG